MNFTIRTDANLDVGVMRLENASGRVLGVIKNIAVASLDASPDMCQKCGKKLNVGEWPFCGGKNNHGFPERPGGTAMIDDQLAGGARYFENLGHEPVYVSSKSQLRDECRARGLQPRVEHRGVPGSDKSPQTSRWI